MLRMLYSSDGLDVVGYIFRPRHLARRAPAIIYNRGGNREFGKVDLFTAQLLEPLVDAGYVVLATQYRGNDGGAGTEEFGGADLADVFSIRALAGRLDYVDPDRIYMVGFSRGAMMTLLALERGLEVRAAAVIGAPVDLLHEKDGEPDPRMEVVYRTLIPGFADRSRAALRARSAIYRVQRITTPLLILHGANDENVDPEQARRLASQLRSAGARDFKLIIVPDGDHALDRAADLRDASIRDWFATH
jgi:dipeptidyl aminopeptidase/acylaminoacyl peptidase